MQAVQRQKLILKQEHAQKPFDERIAEFWRSAKLKRDARSMAIFLGLMAAAVGGRVALQWVPSVEPIIPLAIIAGILFGMKEGATLGAGAYVISNFFIWGLQGPWTIFQALGAGVAGMLGGVFGKLHKVGNRELIVLSLIGTGLYEIIVNIGGIASGIGLLGLGLIAIPLYFATSLPFSAVHVATNAAFARLFAPLLKLRRDDDELKIISFSRSSRGTNTNIRLYKSEPK